jgi:bacillithiol biosynthesis cysteine-adding enzyme BshC
MSTTSIRHTEFPQTSRLFADVLYHPDRASRFFLHPNRDLNTYREAAAAVDLPSGRRAALVDAFRVANPAGRSLERLAQAGTVAVATGQQVGLFSGPSYTIYKALHAAKLAEWLTANGIPAVPVFWLATEDHDFEEVNHAWVFDARHRPSKLEMRRAASGQPVGEVTLASPPLAALRAAMEGLPFAEEVSDLVAGSYEAGTTMGQAFGGLLRRLVERFDILQLDPMLPAFRELAAPVLRRAAESAGELTEALLARGRELTEAGYHAQVHVEPQTSLFFLLENGKRLTLRRNGGEYTLNGRRFGKAELAERAASLSPNALLRPVVQDAMIPTVASILGPAETAYLAQSETLYRAILGRMPVPVPRAGFTILDARSKKKMDRYGLALADFFHGEDALRERIASRLVPSALASSIQGTVAEVESAVEKLGAKLTAFDPTLAKAMAHSGRKIRHQLAKMEGKTGREALRRDQRAADDAASLYGLIYPERHLQERLYSILPFLAKHGLDLIDRIYESIQLDCPDHRLLVV